MKQLMLHKQLACQFDDVVFFV